VDEIISILSRLAVRGASHPIWGALLRLRASVDELQALLTGHSSPLHDDWYVQREV
jgi:uncharacterized protein YukE